MIFLNGNNFDKGSMVKIQRKINHDKDIKRLIKAGKNQRRPLFTLHLFKG